MQTEYIAIKSVSMCEKKPISLFVSFRPTTSLGLWLKVKSCLSGQILGLAFLMAAHAFAAGPIVEVEEPVVKCVRANNGAGPMWCYGSTLVARDGNDVFVSVMETGKDVPPLNNTRWQLWHRTDQAGWKLEQHEKEYRQREPCPISLFPGGPVFLSVNPSNRPPGTKYGPCHPLVMQFDAARLAAEPIAMVPAWSPGFFFTDHSYRGFAADGSNRELLLLNIHSKLSDQYVSWRDKSGKWHARGVIRFPIRACYPQVALRNRAAYVMAIGDIVEPNEEWRKLKYEHLKSGWDYVFRRLFYTWTPDIAGAPFGEPIEVDTVEATAGSISNQDTYVEASGEVHLLYVKRPYSYDFIRDKYFPGKPMTTHLVHAVVKDGVVVGRQVLAETPPKGAGIEPGWARFHAIANGDLYVVMAGTRMGGKTNTLGNFVGRITSMDKPPQFVPLALKQPFGCFCTNTTRGGSKPSDILDIFGTMSDGLTMRYARVRLTGAPQSQPGS
jgi:hypothetical protein